jgi:hypothetical protein
MVSTFLSLHFLPLPITNAKPSLYPKKVFHLLMYEIRQMRYIYHILPFILTTKQILMLLLGFCMGDPIPSFSFSVL